MVSGTRVALVERFLLTLIYLLLLKSIVSTGMLLLLCWLLRLRPSLLSRIRGFEYFDLGLVASEVEPQKQKRHLAFF